MGSCTSTKKMRDVSPKSMNIDTDQKYIHHNQRHDLITGYYRTSQCHETIPTDIIYLLAAFYDNPSTKIFCGLPGLISSSTEIVIVHMNMNKNININSDNLEFSYLKHHKIKNDIISSSGPFCYIPEINPYKHLDGILCVRQQYNISNPVLLLFDPSLAIKSEYMITKYCKIQLLSSSERPQQFIYCGKENGIVCIKYGSLCRWRIPYNLDFIDMENTMYNFNEIDQLFWKSSDQIIMCYLPNKQQLFAVKQNDIKRVCAIFDFKTADWKVVNTTGLKSVRFEFDSVKLCYDGRKVVYIISNKGEIIGYNLNTKQWVMMKVEDDTENDFCFEMMQFTVWMEINDRNKIYCTDGICLRYFDITDSKWYEKSAYKKVFEKLGDKSVVFV